MAEAAERLEFEDAQVYKEKIRTLEKHYAKSIITSAADTSADVFSLVLDANEAFGNFLRIRGGAIVQSLNLGFRCGIEEEPASILSAFIAEIESKFGELSKEVIVPFLPDVEIDGVEFKIRSGATSSPCWSSAPRTPKSSISTASSSASTRTRTSSA